MNTPPEKRRFRLSWKEVVVIVAIIGILVELLNPVISVFPNAPGRAKAASSIKDIVNASNAFYNDYGTFPVVNSAKGGPAENPYYAYGDVLSENCKERNGVLFDVLRAIPRGPNAGHVLNSHQQKYIAGPGVKNPASPKSGFADAPSIPLPMQGCYLDPWGMQYCIVLDAKADSSLGLGDFYSDMSTPETFLRVNVAVFSMGKDGGRGSAKVPGQLTPKDEEPPDDVVSWR